MNSFGMIFALHWRLAHLALSVCLLALPWPPSHPCRAPWAAELPGRRWHFAEHLGRVHRARAARTFCTRTRTRAAAPHSRALAFPRSSSRAPQPPPARDASAVPPGRAAEPPPLAAVATDDARERPRRGRRRPSHRRPPPHPQGSASLSATPSPSADHPDAPAIAGKRRAGDLIHGHGVNRHRPPI